ncbi:MAG: RidA family protein [Woeseiaceae bacterium]
MAYWSYHTDMAEDRSRRFIKSGAPWEPLVGYSRAVRVGDFIAVSGSAPVSDDGELVGPGDPYAQAERCVEVIRNALQQAGAEMRHVVRTRMFVTDISLWEDFARAHHQGFGGSPPATSMVEVSRLIDPGMLIEIEADAIVDD